MAFKTNNKTQNQIVRLKWGYFYTGKKLILGTP